MPQCLLTNIQVSHTCTCNDITSEEAVNAKKSFKRYSAQSGIKIADYHADNGHLADNISIHHRFAQGQIISHCGINAHLQNSLAEHKIRDMQEHTRMALLYACNKWLSTIMVHLWPYVMQHYNNVTNCTPQVRSKPSPNELFSGTTVAPKLCHFHSFNCPAYVLDNALQARQGTQKWKSRAHLGIYLGPSPNHAQSVALVLNPKMGHVLPQIHIKFDDSFKTVS